MQNTRPQIVEMGYFNHPTSDYDSSRISSWLSLANLTAGPCRSLLSCLLSGADSTSMPLSSRSPCLVLNSDVWSTALDPWRQGKMRRSKGLAKSSAAQRIAVFSSIALHARCQRDSHGPPTLLWRGAHNLRPDVTFDELPSNVVLV